MLGRRSNRRLVGYRTEFEAARSSLAQIILGLAASGTIRDALQLKNIAVKAFRGSGSVGTLGKLN